LSYPRPPSSSPTVPVAVPSVPCSDFSGRVLRVGSCVTKVTAGDYVAGFGKSCAAQLCVVADTNVVKLSSSKNLKAACAAGVVTLTASECLRKGEVSAGSTVVVIGASGGVGHIIVQMAKNVGACVIGICRHALPTMHHLTSHSRRQHYKWAVCEGMWRGYHSLLRWRTQL
jgi:NADPH:quinone reductase-like Zn-dependent oxidoreductase